MITNFLKFVEITTKSISILAFLTGISYCLYRFGSIDIKNASIFFIAMLLFDMTTTAINNFIDRRASDKAPHFSTPVSLTIIFIMFFTSMALGLYLAYICGLFVLILGVFCFAIGILYTFGPAPISRTPYGEIASGSVMGYCIPILAIYVSAPSGSLLEFVVSLPNITLNMNVVEMVKMGLAVTPLALTISNIMLANNICDVESDVKINRFTLPYYIGREKALKLFAFCYYACYVIICGLSIVRVLPIWGLAFLLTLPKVAENIRIFSSEPIKSKTFVLSVMNSLIINANIVILVAIGGVLNALA